MCWCVACFASVGFGLAGGRCYVFLHWMENTMCWATLLLCLSLWYAAMQRICRLASVCTCTLHPSGLCLNGAVPAAAGAARHPCATSNPCCCCSRRQQLAAGWRACNTQLGTVRQSLIRFPCPENPGREKYYRPNIAMLSNL
jgi:hypothetical protein